MDNPLKSIISQLTPLKCPTESFAGKTIIVTGANTGLGLEAARYFVRLKASKVILACRDTQKGMRAKMDIEASEEISGHDIIDVWQVDLTSFASVQRFCERAAALDRLDILVENAGVQTAEFRLFEGHETQITVNVISTMLMALSLLPKLRMSSSQSGAASRIVFVASNAHKWVSLDTKNEKPIFEGLKSPGIMGLRYGISKLILIMVVRQLAASVEVNQAQPKVLINTLDPGFCKSELLRNNNFLLWSVLRIILLLFGRSSEMGSRCIIAAASMGPESHGKYIEDCNISTESSYIIKNEALQRKVYDELLAILDNIQPGILANI